MKKTNILCFALLICLATFLGCNNPQPAVSTQKTIPSERKSEQSVASHTTENPTPPIASNSTSSNSNSAQTAGNSPMAKAVDVADMTKSIEKAETEFKKNAKDVKAKKALSDAYFLRAFALTEVAQYRSALGDFRKGLKLDPDNKEAKDMHDQILTIFKSIGREPPKEGEEPAPMPIK